MLSVEFSKRAAGFLRKAEKNLQERINEKIAELRSNPFPQGVKKVVSDEGKLYRVRIGDYRITYRVFYDKNQLFIADIDKRSKIYD